MRRSRVFAVATDPTRFSQWQKGVVDGHMDGLEGGTQPPAVGKILVPLLVRREARKEMPENIAALKRLIEGR